MLQLTRQLNLTTPWEEHQYSTGKCRSMNPKDFSIFSLTESGTFFDFPDSPDEIYKIFGICKKNIFLTGSLFYAPPLLRDLDKRIIRVSISFFHFIYCALIKQKPWCSHGRIASLPLVNDRKWCKCSDHTVRTNTVLNVLKHRHVMCA